MVNGMPCDGCLIVLVRDTSGVIHTLEFIYRNPRDGDNKCFLHGDDWKGHYFSLGKPDRVLCIAEGYATSATVHEAAGYTVIVAFNAAKLEAVVRALWQNFPDLHLIFCANADVNTKGNPGLTKATAAAKAVGGLIADPEFGDDRSEGASDSNDLGQCQGLDAVQSCVANATVLPPAEHGAQSDQVIKAADTVDVVRRLAVLSLIDYDRCRESEAKRLGVCLGTLDAEVSRRRSQLESSTEAGDAVLFDETRWWEDPIYDAVLLTEIADTFSRYLVLPSTG